MNQNETENKERFEVLMARLEQIVKQMESSEAMLDEMLALFEEGTGLVRSCTQILKEAEQKVVLLTKERDGVWNEQNFGSTE